MEQEPKDITNRQIYETSIEPVCMSKTEYAMYQEEMAKKIGNLHIYVDAVDYKLISICHKRDIVVSQDYGVAAMTLGKGAYAIHQSGKWYMNDNIDRMLMERHLNKKARTASGKNHIKGPKKRTPEDDKHFSELFEMMIRMAIQNREGENNGKK